MGWSIYSNSVADPKAEMDDKYSWSNESGTRKVIASSIVGSTYYAAVEHIQPDGTRRVWAGVAKLKLGREFGYKDMDETVGPCEIQCPVRILDLLTPTDNKRANEWRESCRAFHVERRARPKLKDGAKVRFTCAYRIPGDGPTDTFTAVKRGSGWEFQAPSGYTCRLGGFSTRIAEVIPA